MSRPGLEIGDRIRSREPSDMSAANGVEISYGLRGTIIQAEDNYLWADDVHLGILCRVRWDLEAETRECYCHVHHLEAIPPLEQLAEAAE